MPKRPTLPLPPLESLREYFNFSDDGVITLRKKVCPSDIRTVGAILGCDSGIGYLQVRFKGHLYSIHRLVFYHFNGWCPDVVDHKDRNRKNNHPDNLRPATHSQNHANGTKYRMKFATYSQYRGVTFDKSRGKWIAQIKHQYRHKVLGRFNSEEEARNAYQQAASILFDEFASNS